MPENLLQVESNVLVADVEILQLDADLVDQARSRVLYLKNRVVKLLLVSGLVHLQVVVELGVLDFAAQLLDFILDAIRCLSLKNWLLTLRIQVCVDQQLIYRLQEAERLLVLFAHLLIEEILSHFLYMIRKISVSITFNFADINYV